MKFYRSAILPLQTPIPCDLGVIARFDRFKSRPLGQQTAFISQCLLAAERFNISAAVFSLESFESSLISDGIPAWILSGNGNEFSEPQWSACVIQFPSLIYDRFYSSLNGFDPRIEQIKNELEKKAGFLNPVSFSELATDKVRFFLAMRKMNILTPGVLCSRITSSEELKRCFATAKSLILKPVYGRMGRGIIRVQQTYSQYRVLSLDKRLICGSLDELFGCITEICRQNGLLPGDMLVQEAISIPQMHGRWFDIRCLIQRRSVDEVQMTGMIARVSADNFAVPNIDRGGIAVDIGEWLRILGFDSRDIMNKIERKAHLILAGFEKECGLICEMGIDFILDSHGDIWCIEVNAKPGRWAFARLGEGFGFSQKKKDAYRSMRRISIENPMRFGSSLLKSRMNNE